MYLLSPANEVWGKVMFLHLSVSHSVHSGHRSGLYASYWNAYLFQVRLHHLYTFVRKVSLGSLITLQDIAIETMLGRKHSVQDPLLLKLLFLGLKTMSPSVTAKYPAYTNIHCVPFKVSIMCSNHFSIR